MPYYQLDSDKLRPGDVILEQGDGIVSKLIRWVDRGTFSHAFIYIGMNWLMESDEDVRMLMASRVITDKPESFLVLRHPDHPSGLQASEWGKFANTLVFNALHPEANKPYGWLGALATKLPFLRARHGQFFCSQLVAEGYKRTGTPLFRIDIAPEQVTPNMFVSDECLLRPVVGCFSALPEHDQMADLARNRYEVIRHEPVPLAQLGYERSKELVAKFGPRVDALTAKINKKQRITSPMELYLTLAFPDLPEADQVSDEIVTFMTLRFPAKEIAEYISLSKSTLTNMLAMHEPAVISVVHRTLRRDIASMMEMLPLIEAQAEMIKSFPPPPLKRRSIHNWLEKQLTEALATETDLLAWRRALLEQIEEGLRDPTLQE